MRITDIKITNYRAFYGEHHIHLDKDGKNLMLYGENGSGKSSLFTAMKDFFLASVKKLDEVEDHSVSSKSSCACHEPSPPALKLRWVNQIWKRR